MEFYRGIIIARDNNEWSGQGVINGEHVTFEAETYEELTKAIDDHYSEN